jgi:hypothetical protein
MKHILKNTRHKILFVVIYIGVSFIISSCSKEWLEKKTSQLLAVPTTLNDFQLMLNNTKVFNANRAYTQEVTADGHSVPDDIFTGSGGGGYFFNIYTWSHTYPYIGVNDWNADYSSIVSCNVVLEGLANINPDNTTDQTQWNDLKGEALFFRALAFFELSQVYAPVYDSSSASRDLGIPLRLSSDPNIPSTRSTIQQTYNQIIGDLVVAESLLPVIPTFKTHPSSPAANALLARVYLSMGNYASAKQSADACLTDYSSLMDYNNDPSINTQNTYPFAPFNSEVIFHGQMEIADYLFLMDTALYHLYGPGDLRKSLFYMLNPDSTLDFIGSYTPDGSFFSGLATDEVYLIRAECEARSGDANNALTDLNILLVRRYAIGTFTPLTASTADSALILVLTERKKELITRAQRWSDLRRLNRDPRFAITLKRTSMGVTYTLPPGDYRYTFPIPDDVIQYAPQLQQNPGW